jgi:hypothetical protein
MVERVILVDYENVQPMVEEFRRVDPLRHRILIFHGPSQNALPIRVVEALLPIGSAVAFIQCEKSGKDALDFHLAFHLGRLSVRDAEAQFVIVSRDRKGFAQLVEHGQRLGCDMRLVPSLMEALAAPERAEAVDIAGDHAGLLPDDAPALADTPLPSLPAASPAEAMAPAVDPPPPMGSAVAGPLAVKKSPAKKASAKEVAAKKVPAKKVAAKKAPAKTTAAKKAAAKKATSQAPAAMVGATPPSFKPPGPAETGGRFQVTQSAAPPTASEQNDFLQTQEAPVPPATLAQPIAPVAGSKPLRELPVPTDLSKVLAGLLRVGVDKRPGKAVALQRHLASHLRAELSEGAIAVLMRTLYAQGWISDGANGKLEYHLPKA